MPRFSSWVPWMVFALSSLLISMCVIMPWQSMPCLTLCRSVSLSEITTARLSVR